jgi:hypothetical protein
MAETLKKGLAKAKEAADTLSAAVAPARTRKGEPKVIKPAPKAPAPVEPTKTPVELVDGFIAEETAHMERVDFPDDSGDYLFNAVQAYLYHKERITKAELVKKYLTEG